MELRPGYKRTEVGVIPEDWCEGCIADLQPYVTSGSRGWAEYYSDRGSVFLRITNLLRESIDLDLDDLKLVDLPEDDKEGLRTQVKDGDILISITADIGIIGHVRSCIPKPAYINQHIALIRFDGSKADSRFLAYFLASECSQRWFRATTDQGAKAGMNLSGIRSIRAAFPNVKEQRAIATALSDVDALLTQLDRLIAKKRDIKQAAMQQLLTGKTRLPGFGGEWTTRSIGELGTTYGGLVGKSKADFGAGDAQYVTFLNVMSNTVINPAFFDRVRVLSGEPQNLVRRGDLLFNGSSETPEEVGMCALVACDCPSLYLNSFCFGLRLRNDAEVDGLFLAYLIRGEPGRNMMKSLAQGSTRYNISKAALRDASACLPGLQEQTAIATILSDLDAELAALEARRNKTRALKQGMMQALLTGRTRLV